jgi:hypothetical protein
MRPAPSAASPFRECDTLGFCGERESDHIRGFLHDVTECVSGDAAIASWTGETLWTTVTGIKPMKRNPNATSTEDAGAPSPGRSRRKRPAGEVLAAVPKADATASKTAEAAPAEEAKPDRVEVYLRGPTAFCA